MEILTLIKIILFGGSTVLTPTPVDIRSEPILIEFEKPIDAITKGASINIDVTPYISSQIASDGFKEIDSTFPSGCVKAIVKSKKDERITLSKSSGRWGGKKKMLNLRSESGVPTGVKFVTMQLISCKEINNTVITWYNYSK
ncbi:MAG: hypothetical protein K6L60_08750 [Oceanobacter sp.]